MIKVLMGEPWSFDQHLVVLKRYDGITPMEEVDFSKTKFWVQVHNLPFSWLTSDVAMEIGDTLGEVIKFDNVSEMIGGNFLRIQVAIDTSQPLCRGRSICFDDNIQGFVSFKYERLPNFCY